MKKAFLQLHFAVFLAGFTGVLGRLISAKRRMAGLVSPSYQFSNNVDRIFTG